jgi:hypothetical protein
MSIFKRGKKLTVPELKEDELGPGRRLGTKDEDAIPSESSNDKDKVDTKSDEDDDVVEVEPSHVHVATLDEPQLHNAGKKIVKKKITGTRSEAKTLYEGMYLSLQLTFRLYPTSTQSNTCLLLYLSYVALERNLSCSDLLQAPENVAAASIG